MEYEETLLSAVNIYVSSDSNDAVSICVRELEAGHVKLVKFVTLLGDALTSNVVAQRRRGVQLLAEVVTALPHTFFLDTEIVLLLEFFCARLSDHHSIVPLCLAAIGKLIRLETVSSADIIRVVRTVFGDVIVQTLVQSDRRLVYEMFEYLLSDRLSDLQGIAAEFVCGFVQAVDSEKDPRNLLLSLRLVESVAKEFTLDSTLAEQLFEVAACYYPIDFSPPAGLTSTVTREQLSTALLNAMTASPLFGPFCLPLLIEKLSSSVAGAKTDSYQTLIRCCDTFCQKDVDEHWTELWNCIKSDVFAQHPVAQDEALHALSILVRCVSAPVDSNDSAPEKCNKFVTAVFQDCGKYLYEAEQLICKQAGKLLSATCKSSLESYHSVLQLTVPVIVTEFYRNANSLPRQNLLDVLQGLLVAASDLSISDYCRSPLADYKEAVSHIFVSLLLSTDPALRCRAVNGIAKLIVMPSLLETPECNLLMQHVLNVLLSDSESSVVQESVANATLVAFEQPAAVCDMFLPVLNRVLKGSREGVELGEHVDTVFIVQLLSSISIHSTVTVETVPLLFGHISSLSQSDDCSLEVFHKCCVCLTSVISVMSNDCCNFFVDWLAVRCVALTLHICTATQHTPHSHQLVSELSAVIRAIVQCCAAAERSLNAFVSSVLSVFLHGDVIKYCEHADVVVANYKPLSNPDFAAEQVCSVAFLTAVVCSPAYDVIASSSQVEELVNCLVDLILHCTNDVVYVCACKCLSGLINRLPANAFLDATLHSMLSAVQAEMCAKYTSKPSSKLNALTLCIWSTKALVLRNHAQQAVFLKFLIDALADSELASSTADGFQLILSDDVELTDSIFTSSSGATRTMMFKQRFFTLSLPLLLADYRHSSNEMQHSYVLAILHLMQYVPKQVLVAEVSCLIPILLQSLNSDEPFILQTTVQKLTELIVDNSEIFQSYVDDVLPRVLGLTAYKLTMKVRIAAVRCTAEFSAMPVHLILPHRQKVLNQLGLVIDDHKRLVRQEAASARSRWFLIV